jgi:hypothetical protein
MSDYGKHAELTAAVEAHFTSGADNKHLTGKAPGSMSNWQGTPMPFHAETGVNYENDPGHTTK